MVGFKLLNNLLFNNEHSCCSCHNLNTPPSSTSERPTIRRPVVELIYPNINSEENNGNINHGSEEEKEEEQEERILEAQVTIVVNPGDITIQPVVEGELAEDYQDESYALSIFGVTICEIYLKSAREKTVNILSFVFVLATTIIIGAILAQILSPNSNTLEDIKVGSFGDSNHSMTPTINESSSNPSCTGSPSMRPSMAPEPRIMNITSVLFEISGSKILQKDSPQNKALNWILYVDRRNLSFDAPSLIQRYTLMVMFYGMSGESWTINSNYFESGEDECDWFGVKCNFDSTLRTRVIYKLDLGEIKLRGSMPDEISVLHRLITLNLDCGHFSGTIPSSIFRLKNLRKLYLSNCGFSGTISTEIGQLVKLNELILSRNCLSGSLPSVIGQLTSLEKLELESNLLTGTIPTVLNGVRSLLKLELSSNKFTGSIPSEIGGLPFLFKLDLKRNQLNGTIPQSVVDHSSMQKLYLSNNMFSGTIPLSLNQQPMLRELDLGDNDFLTGVIPTFVGAISDLTLLRLSNTRVKGTIPTDIGNASNLRYIELDTMQLSGSVPSELGNLPYLQTLKVQNNDLTGAIPKILCNLSLTLLEANCEFCSCCTTCY